MFQKIVLQNFQSHKHSELNLSPGVNVIIGETDSGKSAIIRALYWTIFGKPSGDSFVRHRSSGECCVSVHLDSAIVQKQRTANSHNYVIMRTDPNEQIRANSQRSAMVRDVFKGFGLTIPKPIVELFNMTDLNFMRQMDPPFLFSKTAGEVAQYLNRLIDLEIIDHSLSNIKRMHSYAENSFTIAKTAIEQCQTELSKYDWLKDADKIISSLEKKEIRIEKMKRAASELDYICKAHIVASHKIEKYAFSWKVVPKIEALINWQIDLTEYKKNYNTLRNAILYAQKTKAALHALPNAKGLSRQIVAIETRLDKLRSKKAHYNGINIVVTAIVEKTDNVQRAIARCKQTALQLKQAMPDACPLCDQPIRRK